MSLRIGNRNHAPRPHLGPKITSSQPKVLVLAPSQEDVGVRTAFLNDGYGKAESADGVSKFEDALVRSRWTKAVNGVRKVAGAIVNGLKKLAGDILTWGPHSDAL